MDKWRDSKYIGGVPALLNWADAADPNEQSPRSFGGGMAMRTETPVLKTSYCWVFVELSPLDACLAISQSQCLRARRDCTHNTCSGIERL